MDIPKYDLCDSQHLDEILNPKDSSYGRATHYLAIDCEMDQIRANIDGPVALTAYSAQGQNIPIKVSLINCNGQIVLDTLIRPACGVKCPGYKSLYRIHGIRKEWLEDAPSLDSVKAHIEELSGKKPLD